MGKFLWRIFLSTCKLCACIFHHKVQRELKFVFFFNVIEGSKMSCGRIVVGETAVLYKSSQGFAPISPRVSGMEVVHTSYSSVTNPKRLANEIRPECGSASVVLDFTGNCEPELGTFGRFNNKYCASLLT